MTTDNKNIPSRRAYDLSKIAAWSSDIIFRLLKEIPRGRVLSGKEDMDALTTIVCDVLPPSGGVLCRQAVELSLRSHAGRELSPGDVFDIGRRMAGNFHRLRLGIPVPPWQRQTEQEWVPAQVDRVVKTTLSRKTSGDSSKASYSSESGALVTFEFLAGLPAGLFITRAFSARRCLFLRREFGFAKERVRPARAARPGSVFLPYRDPLELYRMRVSLLVSTEPREGPNGCEPDFTMVGSTPSLKEWNQEIMRKRLRIGHVCPAKITTPCYLCPVGRSSCQAACHKNNYLVLPCPSCSREKAYFEKEADTICLNCMARNPSQQKKK